jgi:hypothetical protein
LVGGVVVERKGAALPGKDEEAKATAARDATPRKATLSTVAELAAANAARAAAQKGLREEKERGRRERLQQASAAAAGANGDAGSEDAQERRAASTAELKESVAEGLRSIVYMSPEVLFRSLVEGKKARDVGADQLAVGLAKYTHFALKGTDASVRDLLRELAGGVGAGEEEGASALDTFSLADLKERWHVVAGGLPKATSAAQKRAKRAADDKAARDR